MIALVIILVIAAIGGVGAYVIMQFTGVFGEGRGEPHLRWSDRPSDRGSGRFSMPRRLEEVPQGCLVSVLVAMGVWILLWLIVLVIGLRVLLA